MSVVRPKVKRQYGSRKAAASSPAMGDISMRASSRTARPSVHASSTTSSSPARLRQPRVPVPSSDWSDAVEETFSSQSGSMMPGQDEGNDEERSFTPPTSPGPSQEKGEEHGLEEMEQENPCRVLRERKSPTKAKALAGDLRSFFTRASPRKKRRLSLSSDEEGDVKGPPNKVASIPRRSSPSSSSRSSVAPSSSASTSTGSTSSPAISSSSRSTSTKGKNKLEQLYLDPFETAGHATLSCAVCALSYARTPDDMSFHAKHHKKVVSGCEWAVSDEPRGVTVVDEAVEWDGKEGGKVLMVDYPTAEASVRRKLKDVLDTIDTELSSISLTPSQLAESKLFLFVTPQRKVVACAVVQRIGAAFQVVRSAKEARDGEEDGRPSTDLLRFGEDQGAIFCSPTPLPTLLGVQRIWTSTSSRRHGLATLLLDQMASCYIYGFPISHERRSVDVAFSQPTGKGQELARRWTGTQAFKVFVD
ncbi:hypothetical protein JCM21900_005326 [Sporobolomyces salmonicolor]